MHRVGRWLDRGKAHASASTQSLDSLAESQNLETALRAVELIMDDDIEGAELKLSQGASAFHKLARGTLGFMKATLGFEQEIMKEASDLLYDAETSASASLSRAQHDIRAFDSNIYDRGAEFSLCQAEAQVMSAVVGVLNESLTESIKGFYRLRKAYMTLDSILRMEQKFLKTTDVKSLTNSRQHSSDSLPLTNSKNSSLHDLPTSGGPSSPVISQGAHANQPSGLRHAEGVHDHDSDDSDEFFDVEPNSDDPIITQNYTGRMEVKSSFEEKFRDLNISNNSNNTQNHEQKAGTTLSAMGYLEEGPDSEVFANSLDVFIHSGTNLIFGVLSLMISVIPPAFSKLLFIIGFRGDRERGLRMLWQATKFSNINGGMAGLVLFGWYNGLVGFCDIIPDSDPNDPQSIDGYPAKRLEDLLAEMRRRYPKSRLWLIESARMAASRRQVDHALQLLSEPGNSQLRQLEAFHMFERSLDAMFAHRYQLCADSFLACIELNEWSQSLYYYVTAASHLAAFEKLEKSSNGADEAQKHKTLAEKYFRLAPTKVGKKKMMGRQLPFDGFVVRKIEKWDARARHRNCSFIDAIGVPPIEEMIYLWNGHKKMDQGQLQDSLDALSVCKSRPNWKEEALDERAVTALLEAAIWRNMKQHDKSMLILKQEILGHESTAFKGHNNDDWAAPAAHYEMAVNFWMQRSGYIRQHGSKMTFEVSEEVPALNISSDANLVQESRRYLEKAKNWEKYELEARIGIKITAAFNAVRKWEEKHGNSAS